MGGNKGKVREVCQSENVGPWSEMFIHFICETQKFVQNQLMTLKK